MTKVNAAGSALVYSSYLGGNGTTRGTGIAVDAAGNAYVTGVTLATDFPTVDAFQAANRGSGDAFVTKVNAAGSALVYSTYLGGSAVEDNNFGAGDIAVDIVGNAYVTGDTTSIDFPTTPGAFQTAGGVNFDAFVAKIASGAPTPLSVAAIRPSAGGDTGFVSAFIFGSGFAEGATVELVRAGEASIVGDPVQMVSSFIIATTFDLLGKAQGVWDVIVTNSDGSSVILTDGFTIEEGRAPQVWVDIVGRDVIRVGREQTFYVLYGNRGNVDIHDVLLYLHIPKGVSWSVEGLIIPNIEGLPPELKQVGVELDSEVVIPVWIYRIPAGPPGLLRVKIIPPPTGIPGDTLLIEAEVVEPPLSEEFSRTGNFNFTPFVLNLVAEEIARAVIEAEAGESLTLTGVSSNDALATASAIGDCPPDDAACQQAEIEEIKKSIVGDIQDVVRETADPLEYAAGISLSIIAAGVCLLPGVGTIGCGIAVSISVIPTLSSLIKLGRVVDRYVPRVVIAFDPNDKVGSQGAGELRYLAGEEPLRYAIFFENVETATAPAQEVVITDQLDVAKMDLNTLSLGPIAFGDKQVIPPPGLSNFTTDVDLRPLKDLIVRITGSLNPATGLLTWRFTSIDPDTGDLPDDPLVGFLPPNKTPPEGEGSVLFTVMPKPSLATGTQVRNQATIIFDVNPPIDTPEWLNTLDHTKPTSQVLPLAATQSSPSFQVQWSGTDEGAGILDYTIFVSENGAPFTPFLRNTTTTSGAFTAQPGKTYAFYSVARDGTGNLEEAPAGPDATTRVVVDTTTPAITVSATPTTLWPPNGKMVPVTISGTMTDPGSGVNASTGAYTVTDEYGRVQPRGGVPLGSNGSYFFTISLEASRDGNDKDGRQYTIIVSAQDNAGNSGAASTFVIVPHDQGK